MFSSSDSSVGAQVFVSSRPCLFFTHLFPPKNSPARHPKNLGLSCTSCWLCWVLGSGKWRHGLSQASFHHHHAETSKTWCCDGFRVITGNVLMFFDVVFQDYNFPIAIHVHIWYIETNQLFNLCRYILYMDGMEFGCMTKKQKVRMILRDPQPWWLAIRWFSLQVTPLKMCSDI